MSQSEVIQRHELGEIFQLSFLEGKKDQDRQECLSYFQCNDQF